MKSEDINEKPFYKLQFGAIWSRILLWTFRLYSKEFEDIKF